MNLYLDTSLLVAACASEPASDRVHDWLLRFASADLAISPWVETEFAAAIGMKIRLGNFSPKQADQVFGIWRRMRTTQLKTLQIGVEHYRQAADLGRRAELKLRASDALHLAIAIDMADAIVSLDNDLLDASRAVGFEAKSP